jgi:hypothetical protein
MTRILVRQVTDPRPRGTKSLAVADIQPDAAPGPGRFRIGLDVHTVTVHLAAATPTGSVFHARFRPTAHPDTDIWGFIHQAVAAIVKADHPSRPSPR